MFERYTEKARRVVFFSRYEASQFGSPYIETEHLLLGLLREDKGLLRQFIPNVSAESIRQQIESATLSRDKIQTSVDLPLSNECKRIMAYAAEEAGKLSHDHIGTEHLFLGLLREDACFAALLLKERGVTLERTRAILRDGPNSTNDFADIAVTAVGPSGRAYPQAGRLTRRPILFVNAVDGADLGEALSVDVPRVGDEVAMPWSRGRVTRVIFEYAQANPDGPNQKIDLKPEKIVVYLQTIEETQ